MKEETKKILEILVELLEKNPSVRFTQALYNLGITEFADKENPEELKYLLRDPYSDTDTTVLNRMLKSVVKENRVP